MLHEVGRDHLNQKKKDIIYRFFHDNDRGITVHVWQKKDQEIDSSDLGIERFQIAHDDYLIEWQNNKLKSATVDPGEISMGIKQSPVLMMQSGIIDEEHQFLIAYLDQCENEIIKVIQKKLMESHQAI